MQLVLHFNWHKYVCCHCGVGYQNRTSMKIHKKTHEVVKLCACQSNKWVKYRAKQMKKRICTLCGKSYESKRESRKHHACGASDDEIVHCCLCYRGFRTAARLELHKVAHSKSGGFIHVPCFHCKYCHRYMHDLHHFRRHIQRHEKKYKRFWIARALNAGMARDSIRQPVFMKPPFRYDVLSNGTNASTTSNMFGSPLFVVQNCTSKHLTVLLKMKVYMYAYMR